MAKKKKGQKAKAKKKKTGEEKKTKKPTEKELFERQIETLMRSLESANLDLECTRAALELSKQSLHCEEDSVAACASHLKRALRSECDRRLERQQRLLAERDMAALVERRALGKFAASKRNGGVAKSLFLQQKTELEGKLSLLEELRLARSSQLSRLQRSEQSLRERTAALLEKTREEDAERARQLLRSREAFGRMCRDVGSERREAIRLQIRVRAVRQLEENARLRQICEEDTERLLRQQARSRELKREQKSVELERETLLLSEREASRRKAQMEREGEDLLEASPDLRAAVGRERRLQTSEGMSQMAERGKEQPTPAEDCTKRDEVSAESPVSSEKDGERMSQMVECGKKQPTSAEDSAKIGEVSNESSEADEKISLKPDHEKEQSTSAEDRSTINHVSGESRVSCEAAERMSQERRYSSAADSAIGSRSSAIRRRIESIREREVQHCQLEDRQREMSAILRDQAEYTTSLEDEMRQNMDRNGERMSTVLRAGRVLQARCGKLEREGMDFDVLHQIRMILDA